MMDIYILTSKETNNRSIIRNKLNEIFTSTKLIDAPSQDECKKWMLGNQSVIDLNPENVTDNMKAFVHPLHIRILSNILGHKYIAEQIESNDEWSIILEDDSIPVKAIDMNLFQNIKNKDTESDIVFLSIPFKDDVSLKEIASTQIIPACDAFMIRNKSIEKYKALFQKIHFPFNIMLTDAIRNDKIKAIHEPYIFLDGSKIGICTSSLNANNHLIWNNMYNELNRCIHEKQFDKFDQLWNNKKEDSIEFDILRAKRLKETHDIKSAISLYEKILETALKSNMIINNTSSFLIDYMELFNHDMIQFKKEEY